MSSALKLVCNQLQQMKVLLDADIILEYFVNRSGFVEEVEHLFRLIHEFQFLEAFITNKCLKRLQLELGTSNDQLGEQAVAAITARFPERIITIDQHLREQARRSPLRDIDSAEEVTCARSLNLDAIVTQNPQNFDGATLPIWSIQDLQSRLTLESHLKSEFRPGKIGDFPSGKSSFLQMANLGSFLKKTQVRCFPGPDLTTILESCYSKSLLPQPSDLNAESYFQIFFISAQATIL